jgi:hypothetical protein
MSQNGRADMTEMPKAWLNWALVDAECVAIVLSPPDLISPFARRPGTLWETVPHPAGWARRRERRPALAHLIELPFSGSRSSGAWRRFRLDQLNNWIREDSECGRNGARPFDEPPSGLPSQLPLSDLECVVLSLKVCHPFLVGADHGSKWNFDAG